MVVWIYFIWLRKLCGLWGRSLGRLISGYTGCMNYVLGKVSCGTEGTCCYVYWDGAGWNSDMELAKMYEGLGAAQGARNGLKGGKYEIDILKYTNG